MIANAANVPLNSNPGTLPNVQSAMRNWFQVVTFIRLVKTVVNFVNVQEEIPDSFTGVLQPMTAEQLQVKPEGQRSWKWWTVHAYPDLTLVNGELIVIKGTQFKVMDRWGWSEYGYVEYHLVEDYTE